MVNLDSMSEEHVKMCGCGSEGPEGKCLGCGEDLCAECSKLYVGHCASCYEDYLRKNPDLMYETLYRGMADWAEASRIEAERQKKALDATVKAVLAKLRHPLVRREVKHQMGWLDREEIIGRLFE